VESWVFGGAYPFTGGAAVSAPTESWPETGSFFVPVLFSPQLQKITNRTKTIIFFIGIFIVNTPIFLPEICGAQKVFY
jgi:hypothetical protein